MARSPRHIAAVGVLLFWGIALVWLALRHVGQSDQSRIATQAVLRISPSQSWFRIMAGPVQVGYAGVSLDTMSRGQYRIRDQISWDLPEGAAALVRASHVTEYTLGASLGLDSLVSQYSRQERNWTVRATGDGNGWLVHLAGSAGRLEVIPTPRTPAAPPVPLRAVPLRMSLVGALGARDQRTLPVASGWPPAAWFTTVIPDGDGVAVFADSAVTDSVTGRWEPASFDTVATYALVVDAPESPIRLTVDQRGGLVSVEYLFGVRWEREDFDIARARLRERVDSMTSLPVVAWGRPAANGTAGSTRYHVARRDGSPVNAMLLEYLTGGRQVAGHGRIIIMGDTARGPGQVRFPADPLVQSTDSAVAELGDRVRTLIESEDFEAVARTVRDLVSVDTLLDWPADAASALRQGRARPEGAARLLAALFRHAGWNAGMAIGVEPAGDTLRTHAWVEARRRGGPAAVSIDPLTGRSMPTTWVRISAAGSAAPEELFPVVADVRFTLSPQPDDDGEQP